MPPKNLSHRLFHEHLGSGNDCLPPKSERYTYIGLQLISEDQGRRPTQRGTFDHSLRDDIDLEILLPGPNLPHDASRPLNTPRNRVKITNPNLKMQPYS